MAIRTIQVNASASLSANGTTTTNGTITWTAPQLPEGIDSWASIKVSGTWTWTGKNSVTVTINGQSTTTNTPFNIDITGKTSPLTISCKGGNKNATGSNFTWSNLIVTYTYDNGEVDTLFVQMGTTMREVDIVYKKINGTWTKISDLRTLDTSANYVKG